MSLESENCFLVIDLRSDTVTKPNKKMREAMANSEVGDDVFHEDPTVNVLEKRVAELLGKEAAVFVCSGTMGNLTAVMGHCWERGAEVLLGDQTHINLFEQGGVAAVANVFSRTLKNKPDGTFDIEELKAKIWTVEDEHLTKTRLICLENTHNVCFGSVLPLDFINQVCTIAEANGIKVHMDGARLFNASVKLGLSPAKIVEKCDSVSICLSKGLGCPAGSLVVGTRQFIARVRRCRKLLGGGMRQSGVLAAAGLVALDQMIDRLDEDHKHARLIAECLAQVKNPHVKIDLDKVQTNIGYIEVNTEWASALQLRDRLKKVSAKEWQLFGDDSIQLKLSFKSETRLRFVTHADLDSAHVPRVIQKLKYVIDGGFKDSDSIDNGSLD